MGSSQTPATINLLKSAPWSRKFSSKLMRLTRLGFRQNLGTEERVTITLRDGRETNLR
jgi:hypothetical protein